MLDIKSTKTAALKLTCSINCSNFKEIPDIDWVFMIDTSQSKKMPSRNTKQGGHIEEDG
jgi:hypothetical protein